MVDASDLKSAVRKDVPVRPRSPVPKTEAARRVASVFSLECGAYIDTAPPPCYTVRVKERQVNSYMKLTILKENRSSAVRRARTR